MFAGPLCSSVATRACRSLRASMPLSGCRRVSPVCSPRSLRARITTPPLRGGRSRPFATARRDHAFGGSLGRSIRFAAWALSLTPCDAQGPPPQGGCPPGHPSLVAPALRSRHNAPSSVGLLVSLRAPLLIGAIATLRRRSRRPSLGGTARAARSAAPVIVVTGALERPSALSSLPSAPSDMRFPTPKSRVCGSPHLRAAGLTAPLVRADWRYEQAAPVPPPIHGRG